MSWAETKNLRPLALADIPRLPMESLRRQMLDGLANGMRVVQFFGDRQAERVVLYTVLADDAVSKLLVAACDLGSEREYSSLTPDAPSLHLFEREVFEQFGVQPVGHPWLKPVRKGIAGISEQETPYPFFRMEGESVHEVGVGPIHAGVIEPGHFRFSCQGENVYHLEIELGFQHRGIEDLFIRHRKRPGYLLHLAESIAGDSVIGHAGAFVRAMEALHGMTVSRRARLIRTIALELERIGVHLGDLSALSGDVAYLTGNVVFAALRTKVINTTMAICGSRFGRGLVCIGGVHWDIPRALQAQVSDTLAALEEQVELAAQVLFSSSSAMARFEKTGVVPEKVARQLGLVGPTARASGLSIDVRADFPFGAYNYQWGHNSCGTSITGAPPPFGGFAAAASALNGTPWLDP